MALKVILKNRAGEELRSHNLPSDMVIYPEVISRGDSLYILRRVMPDKQSAIYFEARNHTIGEP